MVSLLILKCGYSQRQIASIHSIHKLGRNYFYCFSKVVTDYQCSTHRGKGSIGVGVFHTVFPNTTSTRLTKSPRFKIGKDQSLNQGLGGEPTVVSVCRSAFLRGFDCIVESKTQTSGRVANFSIYQSKCRILKLIVKTKGL